MIDFMSYFHEEKVYVTFLPKQFVWKYDLFWKYSNRTWSPNRQKCKNSGEINHAVIELGWWKVSALIYHYTTLLNITRIVTHICIWCIWGLE